MQYAQTIATGDHPPEPPTRRLREALEEAAHALPTQGPLSVFVHHNTLHAFEHLPFHEAIARASDELDTHGYLTEPELRAAYARGRIDDEDLAAAIDDYLRAGELPRSTGPLPDATLLGIALRHPLPVPSEAGLRWELDEHHARTRLRPDVPPAARERFLARSVRWLSALDPDALRAAVGGEPPPRSLARDPEAWAVAALFEACRGVRSRAEPPRRTAVRSHRELLLEATGIDPAAHVNPWLVRFLAAFLDHGLAEWPMPGRERGMLECFLAHLETPGLLLPAAVDEARALAREARRRALGAEDLVREALDELGVREADRAAYLRRVLLALPGWAGMVHRLESHPEERPPAAGAPSLMELAAIRLILDRAAWARLARRELDYRGPLAELPAFLARRAPRPRVDRPAEGAAAFRLFCVAQLAGLTGEEVLAMGPDGRQAIVDRLDAFDERARRRTLFEAYERHHRERVLAVLAKRRERPVAEPASPRWQLVFCIDDRAESFRRHVEELAPDVQTFGVAGYFGLAIEYVSLDGTSTRLCPAGVVPAHSVREMPEPEHETWIDAHAVRRGVLATAARFGLRGSRALVRGTLLGPPIGFALALPFAVRLLFPGAAERLRRRTERWLLPPPRTRLASAREGGFTLEEQIERVASTLENMGLTRGFAPLVVLFGHGSSSVNNPHESAYQCGACSGRQGGSNARLFATFANRPEVRRGLRARGIDLPDGTWFVGGLQNTATDEVILYDTDRVPEALRPELDALGRLLDRARGENARERCRRFDDAPPDPTPEEALRHVEARAADLGQPRPEYNHATNSICVVGRRALTRGVFLDRRALLVSYDPSLDPDARILERLLASVVPVCAGINLEYYFSTVDNDRFGAGTKTPHNPSGLLGVMDGHASDLRTGLTTEMVEIHEPMRLLMVVESTPETLLRIAARQPAVGRLVLGGWVQLATIDPDTGAVHRFVPERGAFEPWRPGPRPVGTVRSSREHTRGRRDHLPFVLVEPEVAR